MTELPKRQLGRTGLSVTMLGYGAMELRGAPRGRDVTEAQAETILHAVLDAGINYIDTSIDYGASEERIGRYIGDRRAEYYLASKCGCLVGAPPAPRGQTSPHVFTRDNILKGVEQSLARLRTDHLDVLQFHISPSRDTLEQDGGLQTVLELKRAGTVRFAGMSGTLPHLVDHIAMGVFDVFQIPYSAVEREHESIIAAAAQPMISTVIFMRGDSPVPFTKMARAKGIHVIPGVEMFVHQGARQFEIWTGKPAPVDEMMRVVLHALEQRAVVAKKS